MNNALIDSQYHSSFLVESGFRFRVLSRWERFVIVEVLGEQA